MAKDEFVALMNDPLFKRLSKIAQEVYEGRADPETAKAWFELRAAVRASVEGMNDALDRFPPKERSSILRRWIQEFVDERMPPEPVLH